MTELTIVRENLMTVENYTGYCGNDLPARNPKGCNNPRTKWNSNLGQFVCPQCGWISNYPEDFIQRYKAKWNK